MKGVACRRKSDEETSLKFLEDYQSHCGVPRRKSGDRSVLETRAENKARLIPMVQEQTTPVTPEKPIGGRLQTLKKRGKKALLAKVLPLLAPTPPHSNPKHHPPIS